MAQVVEMQVDDAESGLSAWEYRSDCVGFDWKNPAIFTHLGRLWLPLHDAEGFAE